jgi:Flp pilus assembly pilin Flp
MKESRRVAEPKKGALGDESGASTAEYAILVSFVVVLVAGAVPLTQAGLTALFDALATNLPQLLGSAF